MAIHWLCLCLWVKLPPSSWLSTYCTGALQSDLSQDAQALQWSLEEHYAEHRKHNMTDNGCRNHFAKNTYVSGVKWLSKKMRELLSSRTFWYYARDKPKPKIPVQVLLVWLAKSHKIMAWLRLVCEWSPLILSTPSSHCSLLQVLLGVLQQLPLVHLIMQPSPCSTGQPSWYF